MEPFLGKWQLVPELTEGLEAYADAMKMPAELREKMRGAKYFTSETTKEGDSYVNIADFGDRQEKTTFKLGEPFTSTSSGLEVKNLFKVDGDRLLGEHEMLGQKTTSVRYIQGGQLINPQKQRQKYHPPKI
nr:hypothetical protein BaRGS_011481 [Batillaria attramentaria]